MQDKLVLVTGASSGIGRAAAELLAKRGARVLLLVRNQDRLEETVRQIVASGGIAAAYPVDLSEAEAVRTTAERIKAEHGVPDVVINNAGSGRWLPFVETSLDEARQMIELPYLAAFYVTRLFLPEMLARDSGQIACVTSPASHMVWRNASAYIAARHALKGFTEALRAELKRTRIGVTLVTLGTVSSEYWEHNPGSRERLPPSSSFLLPELTPAEAAKTIVDAVERRRSHAVRLALYRLLFALGLNP